METVEPTHEASDNYLRNLIEDCKKMDQKAQFQVYKLYYKTMYNASLSIVNDPMEAEDLMQESFLVAFEHIGSYTGNVGFSAWLMGYVQNRSAVGWSK
jgi:DNA-directed RNA polymerase specialized sigma24 family protein